MSPLCPRQHALERAKYILLRTTAKCHLAIVLRPVLPQALVRHATQASWRVVHLAAVGCALNQAPAFPTSHLVVGVKPALCLRGGLRGLPLPHPRDLVLAQSHSRQVWRLRQRSAAYSLLMGSPCGRGGVGTPLTSQRTSQAARSAHTSPQWGTNLRRVVRAPLLLHCELRYPELGKSKSLKCVLLGAV